MRGEETCARTDRTIQNTRPSCFIPCLMFADLRLFFVRLAFDQLDADAVRAFDERVFHLAVKGGFDFLRHLDAIAAQLLECVAEIIETEADMIDDAALGGIERRAILPLLGIRLAGK